MNAKKTLSMTLAAAMAAGLLAGCGGSAANSTAASSEAASSEAASTTTFKATDNGKIITTQIVPNSGNYNYTKPTKIETVEGGKLITESYEKTVKPAE